ncbi:Rare lipoprotein A (RlpA)-like double-psi beta-barrel [Pseudarcicella hirudinis]|uniref:Probable endolytic peptidoglycan transglycosylase RlpA n=1 Tax=Pseudarcicella hirudinis TaxID=1079859 RepID=A0A1I5ST38_9BACT|nr:septal ring lytic transglycosylase RlpA family protein [Pseudarcicella hirudinis]SFP73909.1 Rare lipoprotein A (RlpA)-like double-psi beta-barrel [Pseudarcicella hirudinis]
MKFFRIGIVIIPLVFGFAQAAHSQKLGDEFYGIASFYSKFLYDKPTSTGEMLYRNSYSAAHMTLPFNTMVEVTNMKNKRFVIVRVNDRGPYKPGREIDLTENAARWLKMKNDGLTKVKIKIVGFDGDIMLEAFDSLTLDSPPKFIPKFYQKTRLRYRKHYRLRKHWQHRKYPYLKRKRLKIMSYRAKIHRSKKRHKKRK